MSLPDYTVVWAVYDEATSETLIELPILDQKASEYLMSERGYTKETLPNSITSSKGSEPTTAHIVFFEQDLWRLAATGNLVLKITTSSPEDRNVVPTIGTLTESQRDLNFESIIEFKKLYPTTISEVVVDKLQFPDLEDNLVIVELKDTRHFLSEKSGYGTSIDDADANPPLYSDRNIVSHDIWENELSPIAGGLILDTTNGFRPEDTTFHNQFVADEYENDYELFNQVLNRTENVFFIDKNGSPTIQKYSYLNNSAAKNTNRDLVKFISESIVTTTHEDDARSSLYEDWDNVRCYFWEDNKREDFVEQVKSLSSNSRTSSELSIFPVTQRAGASSGVQKYGEIAGRYRDEIRLQRNVNLNGIKRIKFNNNIDVELLSEVSRVTYLNNIYEVSTDVEVLYRHGIPHYKYVADFKDNSTPVAIANFEGDLHHFDNDAYSFNGDHFAERYSRRGFYTGSKNGAIQDNQGPIQFKKLGFDSGQNSWIAQKAYFSDMKTNSPKHLKNGGGAFQAQKTGYYTYSLTGSLEFEVIPDLHPHPQWFKSMPDSRDDEISSEARGSFVPELGPGESKILKIDLPNPIPEHFPEYKFMMVRPKAVRPEWDFEKRAPTHLAHTEAKIEWEEDKDSPSGRKYYAEVKVWNEKQDGDGSDTDRSSGGTIVVFFQTEFVPWAYLGHFCAAKERIGIALTNDTSEILIDEKMMPIVAPDVTIRDRFKPDWEIPIFSGCGDEDSEPPSKENYLCGCEVYVQPNITLQHDKDVCLAGFNLEGCNPNNILQADAGCCGANTYIPPAGPGGSDTTDDPPEGEPSFCEYIKNNPPGDSRRHVYRVKVPFTKTGQVKLQKDEKLRLWMGASSPLTKGGWRNSSVVSDLLYNGEISISFIGRFTELLDI